MKLLKEVESERFSCCNLVDKVFIDTIEKILSKGSSDRDKEGVRPKWKDGKPAHTLYISQHVEEYNISEGEFPITSLRPIAWKSGIKEILWIYQDQSNDLDLLKDKYGITWWDDWDIGDRTIGARYGHTVARYNLIDNLLENLENNPMSRRHIINMWQEEEFKSEGLKPCAFMVELTVRGDYLDMSLTQRSNDYIVAGHINKIQYVALLMMLAKHIGLEPGKFLHKVQNLHIYDRHVTHASLLVNRQDDVEECGKPELVLDTDKTNFYDFTIDDFTMNNYDPLGKIKGMELAI